MSGRSAPLLTPEEYLALDRAAAFKSEYFDGQMVSMSGGTFVHSILAAAFSSELRNALAGRDCWVTNSDARVRATRSTFVYPDVCVVCGRPELENDDVLLNPVLIAEVLSDSTERYDRGLKFTRYRSMPTLQDYVLIAQTEARVEVFRRQPDESWSLRIYEGIDKVAKLESLAVDLSLRALYRGLNFTSASTF